MRNFNHIVVGYDGFEREEEIPALAVDLAADTRASLHVVNVVRDLPRLGWTAKGLTPEELHAALVESRTKRIEELLAPARERGITTRAVVRTGSPHVEIIREVLSLQADLLIIVDEPIGRERLGFGTVARRLLRECPCPVLAKRDHRKATHRRVLAAVDVEKDALNHRVLDAARTLAERAGAELVVFHAWTLWGEHLLRSRPRADESEIDAMLADAERDRQSRMQTLVDAAGLQGIAVRQLLLKGDARHLLPAVVDEQQIDVVVMGTACRTGVEGYLVGNTAEKLINDLSCSLLTVKPDGFQSPVRPATD